jgi:hypothetical protein
MSEENLDEILNNMAMQNRVEEWLRSGLCETDIVNKLSKNGLSKDEAEKVVKQVYEQLSAQGKKEAKNWIISGSVILMFVV